MQPLSVERKNARVNSPVVDKSKYREEGKQTQLLIMKIPRADVCIFNRLIFPSFFPSCILLINKTCSRVCMRRKFSHRKKQSARTCLNFEKRIRLSHQRTSSSSHIRSRAAVVQISLSPFRYQLLLLVL
jgi:hypothetical protein